MSIVETTASVTPERIEKKNSKRSLISLTEDSKDLIKDLFSKYKIKEEDKKFLDNFLNSESKYKYQMAGELYSIYSPLFNISQTDNDFFVLDFCEKISILSNNEKNHSNNRVFVFWQKYLGVQRK